MIQFRHYVWESAQNKIQNTKKKKTTTKQNKKNKQTNKPKTKQNTNKINKNKTKHFHRMVKVFLDQID